MKCARHLKVCKYAPRELAQFRLTDASTRAKHHKGFGRLAPLFAWHANDSGFQHRCMMQQRTFHLDGRDVFPTADDHILESIADLDVAIRVNDRGIARMEPSSGESCRRGAGVIVVAPHDAIASRNNLAECRAVSRHVIHVLVDHSKFARGDEFDSLSCFYYGPLCWR